LEEGSATVNTKNPNVLTALLAHAWFKTFCITGFMVIFFIGYMYLLKHPTFPVRTIPAIRLDDLVSFQPGALPIYLSLWFYVSLPPALMLTRREIVGYGMRIAVPCLSGFAVFYFWPSAILPANIDWEKYPSVAFLKHVDTAGNALPSLHVATAVFSALWLHWRFRSLRLGLPVQLVNAGWCVAIAYSTLAIKQHVVLDVFAGGLLGSVSAWAVTLKVHAAGFAQDPANAGPYSSIKCRK
jgi:membrane-associated phospholipid phosphatase